MTKKERVMAAINHRIPDKVPKGELGIEPGIMKELLGSRCEQLRSLEREVAVREMLNMDLIVVNEFPMKVLELREDGSQLCQSAFGEQFISHGYSYRTVVPALENMSMADQYQEPDFSLCTADKIDYYVEHTDLFVFATIGGPVSTTDWMFGMEPFMIYALTEMEQLKKVIDKTMDFEVKRAKMMIDHGINGLIITDDIAFNQGPFFAPATMEEIAYPYYKAMIKAIKAYKDIPVFLHTDGDINTLMDEIVGCGFDGIQSIQPSAGMDIKVIKEQYGERLCLMGNIDLDQVMTFDSPETVEAVVKQTIDDAAASGGFILSTCNILIDAVKKENAIAMYRTAEQYGGLE